MTAGVWDVVRARTRAGITEVAIIGTGVGVTVGSVGARGGAAPRNSGPFPDSAIQYPTSTFRNRTKLSSVDADSVSTGLGGVLASAGCDDRGPTGSADAGAGMSATMQDRTAAWKDTRNMLSRSDKLNVEILLMNGRKTVDVATGKNIFGAISL